MLGTKKEIQWDKKKLIVNIPKGIDSGTILRLRGKKNLLIKVVIKTPKKISKKAEELLKELRNEIY
jgi:DnaJ-class molecular chaperone